MKERESSEYNLSLLSSRSLLGNSNADVDNDADDNNK